ncbi:MAG: TetR/AcrR family transcriptional regulator [Acidimicrobiales bacterium]
MSVLDVELRGRGRPRSPESERAILQSAVDLLAEEGYAGLSVEGVARRAGVGKATIYRRWPSKAELVVAAVSTIAAPPLRLPDTAPVRDALVAMVRHLINSMNRTPAGRILPALVAEFPRHPELAQVFRKEFVEKRRAKGAALIERGMASGELRPDVAIDVLLDLIPGVIYFRLLVSGARVGPDLAERLVDQVLCGAAAPAKASRPIRPGPPARPAPTEPTERPRQPRRRGAGA